METSPSKEVDSILLLDEREESRGQIRASILEQLPNAQVRAAKSVNELRALLEKQDFDVVVLDHALSSANPIELLHEIRMCEHEPSVLVLSATSDPQMVAEVYNNGGQRCIVKSGQWLPELGPTIRQTLRYRKVNDRNRELQARLIEANILLEEKNRRLDEFSATVAHDIRGPLAGLSMKLDFILNTFSKGFEPKCTELLRSGLNSVGRLTGLVQSMYDYAKLGSRAAHMGSVDLEDLIRDVSADMHFEPSKQISIEIGNLPAVWGNDELLRRLFINLLVNGIKYNDATSKTISVAVGGISSQHLGEFVEIVVADNGRGIPNEELEGVFRMFQRGTSSMNDKEGSGVGLAVVQRIVDLHFGKIRVESQVGLGTRFIISLPLRKIDLVR